MVHATPKAKKHLKSKSKGQLIALIMYMLTILKMTNPKAYRSAEKRLGLKAKGGSANPERRSKRKGPPKGKVPPQLRPYLFKKGHKKVHKKRKR